MKKFIFTLLLSSTFVISNAQNFGIKAGVNFSNGKYQLGGFDISTQSLTGFQFGMVGELPISEDLYFSPGLLYSQKGFRYTFLGIDFKKPISYFEVPLNFTYKYDLNGIIIYGQAGPYLGYGISGKTKSGDNDLDIEFGSDNDQLKRMDIGSNLGIGVEIDQLQIGLSYGIGFTNLENANNNKYANRVFSLGLTYFFTQN